LIQPLLRLASDMMQPDKIWLRQEQPTSSAVPLSSGTVHPLRLVDLAPALLAAR
jgi:hypothetical protein